MLVAVAAAFPLVWMVLSSLKTPAETMQVPPVWIPRDAQPRGLREGVRRDRMLGRSMWNSLVIASITTAGILLTSLMAGYAFAKYRFRGRDAAVRAADRDHVPAADRHADPALPDRRLSSGFNASLVGVIVPNLANAFGIFLMRQFIAGVPDDLIDAARIDGASELRILFKIVAPASRRRSPRWRCSPSSTTGTAISGR